MEFVNTLSYIDNPIEEFSDFKYVSWEKEIYPQFKDKPKADEIRFFIDIVLKKKLKSILDLGVGGGEDLSSILDLLKKEKYSLESAEANEVDDEFIKQAKKLFALKNQDVTIHKSNWLDLPKANPEYFHLFDFAFLTGNSLTYIGGGSREYTKKAQQIVVNRFAKLIKKGGYLLIDHRNYDYIRSLMNLPRKEIFKNFSFDYSIYYHGSKDRIVVFPAYISDTVVIIHYYDVKRKIWSKLNLYPIYHKDMMEILGEEFVVEKVWHDFGKVKEGKSLFVQYLCRKK